MKGGKTRCLKYCNYAVITEVLSFEFSEFSDKLIYQK
jgi:hypothetical protein